jgi:hypothetical protein
MIPTVPLGSPSFFVISVHESPESVLFHRPEPAPPLSRLYGVRSTRHVLANRMRGLRGSKARSTAPA